MAHLGDFDAAAVIYGKFATYRPSTGATFTLAGSPALSVYKDNSTTQSTTGVTLTADFDSVTGFNHFAIDTSADGTFYSAGSFFDVVITTGTVDSVSVTGSVVGSFTLRKTAALKPTTAARTLDVSAGGEAGVDWANVGSPTTAVNLSATNIDVDQVVASVSGAVGSVTGAVGSVTGNVGGNVTGSVGSIATGGIAAASFAANAIDAAALAADAVTEIQSGLATAANLATVAGYLDTEIAAILADTNELQSDWVDGGRLDLILDARSSQTSVDDLPTNAELATALGTADDAVLAQVALVKAVTDKVNTTMESINSPGVYAFTVEALSQGPTGASAPTASAIADEVQTRTIAAVTMVNGLAANTVTASALATDAVTEISTGVWATIMEGSRTAIQYMRGFGATLLGKASGMATTTATFRDVDDSKDRVVATVDADGNRSAITLDLT